MRNKVCFYVESLIASLVYTHYRHQGRRRDACHVYDRQAERQASSSESCDAHISVDLARFTWPDTDTVVLDQVVGVSIIDCVVRQTGAEICCEMPAIRSLTERPSVVREDSVCVGHPLTQRCGESAASTHLRDFARLTCLQVGCSLFECCYVRQLTGIQWGCLGVDVSVNGVKDQFISRRFRFRFGDARSRLLLSALDLPIETLASVLRWLRHGDERIRSNE